MSNAFTASVPFSVGQVVSFKAYAELAEGQEPIFTPGEPCLITSIDEDNLPPAFIIASLDAAKSDTVFSDELEEPAPAKSAKVPKAPKVAKADEAPALAAPAKPAKASKTPNLAAATKAAAPKLTQPAKSPKGLKPPVPAQAPKVAVPQPKVEPKEIEIINTASVAELMAGDALKAAQSLINQSEETFFTLGGVLAHIYYNDLYKALGGKFADKQGWQFYVEGPLGIGYRKAMHLIDIYQSFTALEIDEKRLTQIGWSKAKHLTRAITLDNADELIAFAEQHSKEDLAEYIKTTYPHVTSGQGAAQPQERVKKVAYKFALTDAEAEVMNLAIDLAKTKNESSELSGAIYYIVSEWASLHGAVEVTLQEEMARIGAKYGVELGIVEEGEAAAA